MVTLRECNLKHLEVESMKSWISKVDNRLWMLVVGLLFNLAASVAVLLVALSRGVH
jgi:hypothetical protein